MVAPTSNQLRTIIRSQHLRIEYTPPEQTLLLTATRDFIPEDEFHEMLHSLESFVRLHRTRKLIFDQRQLRHFHPRSHAWFVYHWAPRMVRFHLTCYCFVLPSRPAFRLEAARCEERLREEYPSNLLRDCRMHRCQSLLEAVER